MPLGYFVSSLLSSVLSTGRHHHDTHRFLATGAVYESVAVADERLFGLKSKSEDVLFCFPLPPLSFPFRCGVACAGG